MTLILKYILLNIKKTNIKIYKTMEKPEKIMGDPEKTMGKPEKTMDEFDKSFDVEMLRLYMLFRSPFAFIGWFKIIICLILISPFLILKWIYNSLDKWNERLKEEKLQNESGKKESKNDEELTKLQIGE